MLRVRFCSVNDAQSRSMESATTEHVDVQERDVPPGWARTLGTNTYVRMLDGVTADFEGADELCEPQVCKSENFLSLPAIVKFYEERLTCCTQSQADVTMGKWREALDARASDWILGEKVSSVAFTSSLKFFSNRTNPVFVQVCLMYDPKSHTHTTTATTRGSDGKLVDTYTIDDDAEYPSIHQIVQHIPGLHEEMYANGDINPLTIKRHEDTTDLTEPHGIPNATVRIKQSDLCINPRKAIIDIETEEADLTTKLDAIRKRKREMEDIARGVRAAVSQ